MAQKKISQLTAAEALAGTEVFAVVQGGATKRATAEQIRAYMASQPNVFTVTQRIESAAPALQFSENDTVDKNWEFIGVAGALRLDELNDAFSNTGTHHTFTHGGGTQFGSPTGGDQGAGTVNAIGLYENGTGVAKLSGGADANFTAMPQVGGDPIVESDSNADGEFTRWADGTQVCSHTEAIAPGASSSVGGSEVSARISRNYPQSFISPPGGGVFGDDSNDQGFWTEGRATSTGWEYKVFRASSFTGASGAVQSFFAVGKWK